MESSGRACCLLLLTMAAVSSGRNATEYFRQARFQHTPSRPEDALVFFTDSAPPLICELEEDGDWIGGDRLKSDLILEVPRTSLYHACSFEGNATAHTNLKRFQNSLPGVFTSKGKKKIQFYDDEVYCTTDSQLPEEYFQLRIQRPSEEQVVKCRPRCLNSRFYLRFPGYPTIICKMGFLTDNSFNVPGIAGDPFQCEFLVFLQMRIVKIQTEKLLYQSLINGLPIRPGDNHPRVTCSHHTSSNRSMHFQLRLPCDSIYDCMFEHA